MAPKKNKSRKRAAEGAVNVDEIDNNKQAIAAYNANLRRMLELDEKVKKEKEDGLDLYNQLLQQSVEIPVEEVDDNVNDFFGVDLTVLSDDEKATLYQIKQLTNQMNGLSLSERHMKESCYIDRIITRYDEGSRESTNKTLRDWIFSLSKEANNGYAPNLDSTMYGLLLFEKVCKNNNRIFSAQSSSIMMSKINAILEKGYFASGVKYFIT